MSESSDHLVDAVPPVNTLGNEFIASYFIERNSDAFRIVGKILFIDIYLC